MEEIEMKDTINFTSVNGANRYGLKFLAGGWSYIGKANYVCFIFSISYIPPSFYLK